MKRSSSITLIFTTHLALLMLFMAAPASVIGQSDITITTIEQLQAIGNEPDYPLDGYYKLGADIDASATSTWNAGAGFAPIGTNTTPFSGALNGQGFAISNLYIYRPGEDYVGLFGYVSGELATVANTSLVNASITGRNYTGALVGYNNNGTIRQCSSAGAVSANSYVGGIVGRSRPPAPFLITNCYSKCEVTGNGGVGGLVGFNESTPISTSYSAGKVTGGVSNVGGLIGGSNNNALATNCFWDISTSGQSSSAGGTGKTTVDMKKLATFTAAGWDFKTVWGIFDGSAYPFFRGANDLPQAEPDSYTVGINSVFTAAAPGVLKNDSDADGDTLTARLVTGPSHGELSLKSTGSFTYTPDEDFNETDHFTYKALAGGDNTTAVTVTLIMGNTAPVAVADTYPTSRNLPLHVPAPGVLVNDTDPSGDTFTAVLVTGPVHGELTLRENGSFSYKPEKDFSGKDNITSDNFTYIASDGELDSDPATVIINFTPLCSLESLLPDNVTDLMPLRRYRDEVLAKSASGRAFIKFYYRMSPLADKIFKNSELLRRTARKIVTSSLPWVQERLTAHEEF
jgi:VCBS repeat-containing protein